jgi:beta-lysine 5,6-aminomutase alpha subunit
MAHLQLDAARIASARDSARRIARQVWQEMQPFTTTTVERASLRLMGVDGVDDNQVPLPNRVVEHLQTQGLLPLGAPWWWPPRWPSRAGRRSRWRRPWRPAA